MVLRFLIPVLLLSGTLTAQTPLEGAVEKFLAHPLMEGAVVGLAVRDARSGATVLDWNAAYNLVPASNQKLLVAAAAWEILGPDWRFPTVLGLYGVLKDSLWEGELRITGQGDPTLGSQRLPGQPGADSLLNRWATWVRNQGVAGIRGQVLVRPDRFPGPPVHPNWEWSDLGTCYAQGIWPVNWMENCLPVNLERSGSELYLTLDTLRLPWPVVYEGIPGTAKDQRTIQAGPYAREIRIFGPADPALPLSFRVSVPDPSALLLWRFRDRLEGNGIWVQDLNTPFADSLVLWRSDTVWSPPLRDIVGAINAESHNLYAEALLRALGQAREGQAVPEAGLKVLRRWLQGHELPMKGIWLDDGSGMSRHNALNAGLLADLLVRVHQRERTFRGFRDSLARPGRSGTLRGALQDKRIKDRVWAKTGSLNRVRSLSGYLETRDGRLLSFSILVNQFGGKPQDFYALAQQLLLAIYESTPE